MNPRQKKKNALYLDWFNVIIYAFITVILIFTFVVRTVYVDGNSMNPTLQNGDRLFARTLFYTPKAGDIVAIDSYTLYGHSLIKRVIAVGGDTVDFNLVRGEVIVNDEVVNEDYKAEEFFGLEDVSFPLTVPEGTLFVMGDNRNYSTDSRSTKIGFINEEDVLGKVIFRFSPLNSIRGF